MPIVGDLLAGRYRIGAPLGAGGMASVWRARDERLGREVAAKILLANLAADPVLAARFDREARALAAASHPAIVAIFDVEPGDPTSGREPFYVMELCGGRSLADRLSAGPLPPDDAVHVVAAVAGGLAALHDRGIVHRDVKPANVLECDGRFKLADFGLVRSERAAEETSLTAGGTIAGTLPYLAPELLAGHPASAATDTYSLGVVAFQALTGRLPRPSASMAELVEARHVVPPRVSAAAPELGNAFDSAVATALSPEPDARTDVLGLAADLGSALGRWHRSGAARRRGLASRAGASATGPPAASAGAAPDLKPVDSSIDTVVARAPGAGSRGRRRGPGIVVLAAVAGILVGLATLSGGLGDGGDATPSTSPPGLALPSPAPPSATPTAPPTPTVLPTATPRPTPTANPAAPALQALDVVREAIDDARRNGGLKRPDANELQRRADDIGDALKVRDFGLARERTDLLADRVDGLKNLDRPEHDALRAAVAALQTAIP